MFTAKNDCKMLTIKAMVKKDGLRVDRNYNVKLCFTYKRKVKRLSTSLFVSADDLTKSLSFKEGTAIKQKADRLVEHWKSRACLTPEGKAALTPENLFVLTPVKS